MPNVSIIVPIYNLEGYIQRCVESILSQSYRDFEVLLIDDGSIDRTGKIIDEYLADSRVRVFHNSNMGAGASREFGVKQAIGKWVMFVDGDDILPYDAIEKLLDLDDNSFDIISGISQNVLDNTFLYHKRSGVLSGVQYIEALLCTETIDGMWAKLIRRDLFLSYKIETPSNIIQNEDLLMLIALAKTSNKVIMSNDVVSYAYIAREGSARSLKMPIQVWIKLFDNIELLLGNLKEDKDEIKKSFVVYRLRRLRSCVYKGIFIGPLNPYRKKILKEAEEFRNIEEINKLCQYVENISLQLCEFYFGGVIRQIKRVIAKS